MRTFVLIACMLAAGASQAHDGHALSGGHWHATDAFGWIAVAAAVALGVWISRK